ncbi:uncharacterized protein PAC_19801 [Phialocephala subalpina]|uniref:Uncharacterized protein n=1 Tax=Phialocephala subalpina TaxID=576137 RepID=A0A1L7XXV1_9HELO|nr:uncharacterized protein PAC_19801 [Phialocephala subalpina]
MEVVQMTSSEATLSTHHETPKTITEVGAAFKPFSRLPSTASPQNPPPLVSHEARDAAIKEYDGCICACQTTFCLKLPVWRYQKAWKYAWFTSTIQDGMGKECAVCEDGCDYRKVHYTKKQAFYWTHELTTLKPQDPRIEPKLLRKSETGLRLSSLPPSTWVSNIHHLVLDASCSRPNIQDRPSSTNLNDFLADFINLKKLTLFRWSPISYGFLLNVRVIPPIPIHPIKKRKLQGDEVKRVQQVLGRDKKDWPEVETWWGKVPRIDVEMDAFELGGSRQGDLNLGVDVLGAHFLEPFEEET